MKISVVVVNYNGESYIVECLDSVLASRYANFEVVVVENGSTDGSWRLLQHKYIDNLKVNLVKSKTNLFFAGGSNLGAKKSKGEWVVFLNADTVVSKDWLRELINVAEQEGEKTFLQPKILTYGTKRIDCVVGKYYFPGWGAAMGRGKQDNYEGVVRGDYANGTCLMVNHKFFNKLGGFDEGFRYFYEDVDLQLRSRASGGKAMGVMAAVIEHKGSLAFKQNVSSDEVVYYYRRNRLLTAMKNFRGIEKWGRMVGLGFSYLVLPRIKVSVRAINETINWWMRREVNEVRIREVEKYTKQRGSWLDLGCGEGELGQEARERGWMVVEIDEKKGKRIENFETKEKYQVVSMYHVLEHVKKPGEVLETIKDWSKQKGILVVEVPVTGGLTAEWLKKDYFIYQDKTHRNYLTEKEWENTLFKSGWKVVGKGKTYMEFPIHIITASFKGGVGKGLLGIVFWLPLKILSILGLNPEIVRFYCHKM